MQDTLTRWLVLTALAGTAACGHAPAVPPASDSRPLNTPEAVQELIGEVPTRAERSNGGTLSIGLGRCSYGLDGRCPGILAAQALLTTAVLQKQLEALLQSQELENQDVQEAAKEVIRGLPRLQQVATPQALPQLIEPVCPCPPRVGN